MFIVSGGNGTGKTRLLLEKVKEENAVIVCADALSMIERAYAYGIIGLKVMSYEDFDALETIEDPVYIHNIHNYLTYCKKNVKGFSVSLD